VTGSPDSSDTPREPSALASTKLTRVRLADTLLTQLRQQILSGRLEAGTSLPSEREIGEAFGVGRTTVREALQGLLATGFVERSGNQLVVRPSHLVGRDEVAYAAMTARVSVEEVFETRKLLEVEIARLAATSRTEEDLADIWAILETMDETEPTDYHAHDIEFHSRLARASGNRVLAGVYEASIHLFFRLPAFWKVFGKSQAPIGGGREGHQTIYKAIETGDADSAARVVFEHLDLVERALVAGIRTGNGGTIRTE